MKSNRLSQSPIRSKNRTRQSSPFLPEPSLHLMSNFVFQGCVNSSCLMTGHGIVITDSKLLFAGQLRHDLPNGFGIMVFDNCTAQDSGIQKRQGFHQTQNNFFVYSKWKAGVPQGPTLITSNFGLLVCQFKQGLLFGVSHKYNFRQNVWHSCQFVKGQLRRSLGKSQKVPSCLKSDHILNNTFLNFAQKSFKEIMSCSKGQQFMFMRSENYDTLGFHRKGILFGLGAKLKNFRVIEQGEFKEGILEGYGYRSLNQLSFYEGYFSKGEFQGFGLFHSSQKGVYVIGAFSQGRCIRVYNEGRGRGKKIFNKIKDLQIRNHPKVISKRASFENVAVTIMNQFARIQKLQISEEADTSVQEIKFFEQLQTVDKTNKLLFRQVNSPEKDLQQVENMRNSDLTKQALTLNLKERVREFQLNSTERRSPKGSGRHRPIFATEDKWNQEEVWEEQIPQSVRRLHISKV